MPVPDLKDTDRMSLHVERTIPLWGVVCAIGTIIGGMVSVVWHVANIDDSVAAMRDAGLEIRTEMKEQNTKMAMLEGRLTRVETLEQQHELQRELQHYNDRTYPPNR
ncbi:hypothetical protein [Paraburkholderia adhaesiva]|uniref:hypothetical protein n=1 Tax=Paraburkholderia adhaesiva TaxID=2883244 RepID=UPI001F3D2F8B|nr:hypothetical protein [Paraburkholderia adhaesiva]